MHRSSFCGVNCLKCKVYIATMADNDILKKEIADEWGALYKRDFAIEDMVCKGCKSDVLFGLCALCDITPCNKSHGTANCEDCDVFPCKRIQSFFDFHNNFDTGNVFS